MSKNMDLKEEISCNQIIDFLEILGFKHVYTGKTRETFINQGFPELLYILATDRISIFDIVLNCTVPMKGAVLTAMTVYWLTKIFNNIPNHLVAFGEGIKKYLLKKITESEIYDHLTKHMIIVKKTEVLKIEAIVRGFLTGSGLKSYNKNGTVCGISLPPDLVDGSEIPIPIFTPSTKADYGAHDENISFEEMVKIVGEDRAELVKNISLFLYTTARGKARKSDIIIADTKFEFGVDKKGELILIDEVLTPDSSRFWPAKEWLLAKKVGKTPPSLDKQPIRNAGEKAKVKGNPSWTPSQELLNETSENYQKIFELLVGKSLQQFWLEDMRIVE